MIDIETYSEVTPDFKSLSLISPWSMECWKSAWEDLVGYEKPIDNLDKVWAFVIRVAFKTPMSPTGVVDMYFEILDQQ